MSLNIYIWDVGHGLSVHAFTPVGETIVIDLGVSSYFSPMEILERKNISTIDMLIISHPHGDHIDEIETLKSKGFFVRQFHRPSWLSNQEVYNANQSSCYDKVRSYIEMSENYNEPIPDNALVGSPDVSGGVRIETFYSSDCGHSNINNHSLVTLFEYQGVKVLIPGDNEPASWKSLLEQPYFKNRIKNTSLFVASHHGRESGYHPDLFKEFTPDICVVSDGRVQDTDATSRYSSHASGWLTHHRENKPSKERSCLTTRSDGFVHIKIGKDQGKENPYMAVTID